MSRSKRVVAGSVMKLMDLRKNDASNHRMIYVATSPTQILLITAPCHLAKGPCNVGESQHESMIEIGKT